LPAQVLVVHHVQPASYESNSGERSWGSLALMKSTTLLKSPMLTASAYMDGARFANAVVSLGLLSCRNYLAGWCGCAVIWSNQNGAMAAEAVVFNQSLAETFSYRRKRSGHLFSKMRFLSAQLEAYITNDLWLRRCPR